MPRPAAPSCEAAPTAKHKTVGRPRDHIAPRVSPKFILCPTSVEVVTGAWMARLVSRRLRSIKLLTHSLSHWIISKTVQPMIPGVSGEYLTRGPSGECKFLPFLNFLSEVPLWRRPPPTPTSGVVHGGSWEYIQSPNLGGSSLSIPGAVGN
jgi:hypothetical protein